MSKGALFVRLFYPGFLGLPESTLVAGDLNGQVYAVGVVKHLRPVEILDFGNEIQTKIDGEKIHAELKNKDFTFTENSIAARSGNDLLFLVDSLGSYHRRFRHRSFTEIQISYEIESAPDYTEKDLALHEILLSMFIDKYRCITHDVTIRLPRKLNRDIPLVQVTAIEYDEAELKENAEDRLVKERSLRFGVKQMSIKEFAQEIPTVSHDMEKACEEMATPTSISPVQAGLVNALEEVAVNKNPTYAFLSSFIIAERMLAGYLHQVKIKRGASKSKLDDFEEEVPFSYMLNIELPVLVGNPTDDDRQVIGRMDNIRRKRNDVIHRGEAVLEQEALDAINAVEGLRAFLGRHPV